MRQESGRIQDTSWKWFTTLSELSYLKGEVKGYTPTLIRHWMKATGFEEDVIFLTDLAYHADRWKSLRWFRKGLRQREPDTGHQESVGDSEAETAGAFKRATQTVPHASCVLISDRVILSTSVERQKDPFSIVYPLINSFTYIYSSLLLGATVLCIEAGIREEMTNCHY